MHLGQNIEDVITGISGILVEIRTYLHESTLFIIARKGVDCDGKPWPDLHVPASRCVPTQER